MIPAPIPLERALALRAEKEAALAAPPLAATLDDGEDQPTVQAPKPRGATDKAYTALERPGQQPFFLPNAAIVNARRAKVGSGGTAGGPMTDASDSETGAGPAPTKAAPRARKASSPRAPKEYAPPPFSGPMRAGSSNELRLTVAYASHSAASARSRSRSACRRRPTRSRHGRASRARPLSRPTRPRSRPPAGQASRCRTSWRWPEACSRDS
jgi:hypothetical protein